jgi:hypothetical protein
MSGAELQKLVNAAANAPEALVVRMQTLLK